SHRYLSAIPLHSPLAHRTLLSFPTRRSSDLHAELAEHFKTSGFRFPTSDEWEFACGSGEPTLFRWGDHAPCDRYPLDCGTERVRSEEHTSELQSLRHLVCRLLLEKKKKIHIK